MLNTFKNIISKYLLVLLFVPLVLLNMILAPTREINSSTLTGGVVAVVIFFGLIYGAVLLALKLASKSFWPRLFFVLGVIAIILCYVDFFLYANPKVYGLFGFVDGTRPLWGKVLFGCVILVMITGLCFALWKYQNEAFEFFFVLFAATLIFTVFFSPVGKLENFDKSDVIEVTQEEPGNLKIYIVLDSMIGSGGLKTGISENTSLAQEIDNFYEKYGFNHYDRAFSKSHQTIVSIPATLNGISDGIPDVSKTLVTKKNRTTIVENKFFDSLKNEGRLIDVYQTQYMNYCSHDAVVKCNTISTGDPFSSFMPNVSELKSNYLIYAFRFEESLERSVAVKRVVRAFFKPIRAIARKVSPKKYLYATTPSQYSDLMFDGLFDNFADDVISSKSGTYFAHFLMPHFPYRADIDCQPVTARLDEKQFDRLTEGHALTETNADLKREELYQEYRDQVVCVYSKLSGLFDTLKEQGRFDDATITLLGDHGSRISNGYFKQTVTDRDMIDNYSTLFATKKKNGEAKLINNMVSVQQLLLESETQNAPNETYPAMAPRKVVIQSSEDRSWSLVPMPDF